MRDQLRAMAALVALLSANMGGAELVPRPYTNHSSGGAFGGGTRYPVKGHKRAAGSKLARKAARGKL